MNANFFRWKRPRGFAPMDDVTLMGYAGCEFDKDRPLICERQFNGATRLDPPLLMHAVIDDAMVQFHVYDSEGNYLRAWGMEGKRPATRAVAEAFLSAADFSPAAVALWGFQIIHEEVRS